MTSQRALRYYRAALQSTTSIFDAFLNRYVLVRRYSGRDVPDDLKGPASLEKRIEAWLRVVANKPIEAVNQTPEWSDFLKLKNERNRMLHAVDPYLGVSIKEMATGLNSVRRGVGGLLRTLRKSADQPTLGFIERIRSAPEVTFRERK